MKELLDDEELENLSEIYLHGSWIWEKLQQKQWLKDDKKNDSDDGLDYFSLKTFSRDIKVLFKFQNSAFITDDMLTLMSMKLSIGQNCSKTMIYDHNSNLKSIKQEFDNFNLNLSIRDKILEDSSYLCISTGELKGTKTFDE